MPIEIASDVALSVPPDVAAISATGTMETALLTLAYLIASVLFILSLRGLSSQETASRGNFYGMLGMAIAIVATLADSSVVAYVPLIGAVAVGTAIGYGMATRVAMTAMPELVALLHSFVGLAAVLVGYAHYLGEAQVHPGHTVLLVEIFLDVFIGAITFTGSVIAFLKLRGSMSGNALVLPGRHMLNLAALVIGLGLVIPFASASGASGMTYLFIMTVVAGLLGVHLVMAIGGADMPVVVSMLNSYSGWTAAAAGFMLENDLLIVTGALVGSSGAILSYIMCRAMNRSIWSVIFGGFGSKPAAASSGPRPEPGQLDVNEIDVEGLSAMLKDADNVIVIPGYGMAVARAQHAVREMTDLLKKHHTKVRFGIHPVAGRLPGHMNVLLAEASVPYDIVHEMEELNDDFPRTTVALVIGANDIVNPGAQTDETSPIYGMPVLEAWEAKHCVILKRSRRAGYAGVDNPLFYKDNTQMLFGDAKDTMDSVVTALKA